MPHFAKSVIVSNAQFAGCQCPMKGGALGARQTAERIAIGNSWRISATQSGIEQKMPLGEEVRFQVRKRQYAPH